MIGDSSIFEREVRNLLVYVRCPFLLSDFLGTLHRTRGIR